MKAKELTIYLKSLNVNGSLFYNSGLVSLTNESRNIIALSNSDIWNDIKGLTLNTKFGIYDVEDLIKLLQPFADKEIQLEILSENNVPYMINIVDDDGNTLNYPLSDPAVITKINSDITDFNYFDNRFGISNQDNIILRIDKQTLEKINEYITNIQKSSYVDNDYLYIIFTNDRDIVISDSTEVNKSTRKYRLKYNNEYNRINDKVVFYASKFKNIISNILTLQSLDDKNIEIRCVICRYNANENSYINVLYVEAYTTTTNANDNNQTMNITNKYYIADIKVEK